MVGLSGADEGEFVLGSLIRINHGERAFVGVDLMGGEGERVGLGGVFGDLDMVWP